MYELVAEGQKLGSGVQTRSEYCDEVLCIQRLWSDNNYSLVNSVMIDESLMHANIGQRKIRYWPYI